MAEAQRGRDPIGVPAVAGRGEARRHNDHDVAAEHGAEQEQHPVPVPGIPRGRAGHHRHPRGAQLRHSAVLATAVTGDRHSAVLAAAVTGDRQHDVRMARAGAHRRQGLAQGLSPAAGDHADSEPDRHRGCSMASCAGAHIPGGWSHGPIVYSYSIARRVGPTNALSRLRASLTGRTS